jgi:thioredoxin-like negative regulator of GroEL
MNSSHKEEVASVRTRTIPADRVVPVFLVVLLLIGALAVIDMWLARVAAHHRSATGRELFEQGQAAAQESPKKALELFRTAYNHNPSNSEYQLAFARSLRANGREREGTSAVRDLLTKFPAHGPGNAEMARILAQGGDWQQAAWFYHRAIFGEWDGSPDLRSLRFELAELLARNNAREELQAEVITLEAMGGAELDARSMARLLLAAGEYARAERQYRTLLRKDPNNPGLLVGLARTLLAAGKYPSAERQYKRAVNAGGDGSALNKELQLVSAINDLDPTVRRLPAGEKQRRTHELVSQLVEILTACAPEHPKIVEANKTLEKHQRMSNKLAAAEANLELFETLWTEKADLCGKRLRVPQQLELLAAQILR